MTKSNSISGKSVGRRTGGGDTRASILRAAQYLFSSQGLDQTTMRQIAARADVDPALIVHYFKTKQQLFMESVAPIIDSHRADTLTKILEQAERAEMGQKIAEAFVATITNDKILPLILSVIRSITSDSGAADIMRTFSEHSLIRVIEEYVPEPDRRLKAELIASQFIGILVARYIIRVEPLASAEPAALVAYLAPRLQLYFDEI